MINLHGARFKPGNAAGHYESFFLRANHPTRPLAFWIRYTVFSPKGSPGKAIGELWAVVSNQETGVNVAVKKELPIEGCQFDPDELDVRIGEAKLDSRGLRGDAASGGHEIRWKLRYYGQEAPVLLLPEKLYTTRLPKAKSLVGLPMARFHGTIQLDGETIEVEDWIGSQNHNWGAKHTDRYAYGQVCGFDNAPESFLELATARVKIGPFWTPALTPIVLRHGGREFALNGLRQSLEARASYEYFQWRFAAEDDNVALVGEIQASREHFVGLRYYNPPGGTKTCLNSKLASCRLSVTDKRSDSQVELSTQHRAAFEILTDDDRHEVRIQA
jgi:hypothetical protein